ncbi:recombinase family protein [Chelativorans xinjiangense]|uniref:recombinase family protein n=1 Tax=Chelativorans xinjiangense TaxID=2681485 RepID=UPI00135BC059|nr:recombinase family protein [Chelativorans xinjiangense]
MKSAAIYARFSTDLQDERSIEDQVALCRKYAERENLNVVAVFEDRARSGGSVLGRDGLLHLLDRAREHGFDVLVVEALDRLSRDMEDLAGIHKRLTFLGIEIRAVHEGLINTVVVGLRGLVGQLYREDNAHKVRRGQSGRVGQGLNAGGLTYGYAAVPGDPGRRKIVETEAEIVRQIFHDYVAGSTPRDIAHWLNRERIAPPRGRAWNASTINGNAQRGTGILQNELYEERKRLAAEADANRIRLERRLGELTREIDRLVDAIAKGLGDPAVLGPRSTALHEERKGIEAELDKVPPPTEVVALHPAMLARYEQQLTRLQEALSQGIRAGDTESAEAMRDLVETVTVFRDPSRKGGIEIEISGRLTALLGEKAYPNGVKGVWGKVVAEVRYRRSPRQQEPVFSLEIEQINVA